jgi:hypothetical protein
MLTESAKLRDAIPSASFGQMRSAATDAMHLIGQSVYDLSMRRREMLRSSFAAQSRGICGKDTPITKQLFGDDFGEVLRRCQATNRATSSAMASAGGRSNAAQSAGFREPRRLMSGRDSRRGSQFRGRPFRGITQFQGASSRRQRRASPKTSIETHRRQPPQ